MKFYVCGKWGDKPLAQRVMNHIRSAADEITHDWTTFKADGPEYQRLAICAGKNVEGVQQCEILIALMTDETYAYRGTFTEIGVALGLAKSVIIVGPVTAQAATNCFWWHTKIWHADTLESLWMNLKNYHSFVPLAAWKPCEAEK